MKTFTDNAGRTWTISVHVTAIKRVRGLLGLNLLELVDDGFQGLGKLLADPIGLVDVLYVLCKDEADKLGVSDEDFGRAMYGDAIEAARNAFLEEYADFFQDPRVRAGLRKLIAKSRDVTGKLLDHLDRELDRVDVDAEASKLIDRLKNAPGSSGSTPGPSPSES